MQYAAAFLKRFTKQICGPQVKKVNIELMLNHIVFCESITLINLVNWVINDEELALSYYCKVEGGGVYKTIHFYDMHV